jgi:hypothetical protein
VTTNAASDMAQAAELLHTSAMIARDSLSLEVTPPA